MARLVVLLFIIAAGLLLYVGLSTYIRANIFPGAYRRDPIGAPHRDFTPRFIPRGDGQTTLVFARPHENATHSFLYLHGNGAAAAEETHALANLMTREANIYVMEYTGYGGQRGRPSEREIRADVAATVDEIRANHPNEPLIIIGFSLGAATTLITGPDTKPDGVLVLAPLTRAIDLAPRFLPRFLLGENRFEALHAVPKIDAPIAIVHCTGDTTIPVSHGRAIAAAVEPANLAYFATPDCTSHHVPETEIEPALRAVEAALR